MLSDQKKTKIKSKQPLFHFDYFSLRNENIQNWYETFFWPISREGIHDLNCTFTKAIHTIIQRLGYSYEGDCLLIVGLHIAREITNFLHHYIIVNRLQEQEYRIHHSPRCNLLPLLLNNKVNEYRPDSLDAFSPGPWVSLRASLRNRTKTFWYNKREHKSKYLWNDIFHQKPVIALPHDYVINRRYTKQLCAWIRMTSPEEWFHRNLAELIYSNPISSKSKAIFQHSIDEYIEIITQYVYQRFKIVLSTDINQAITRFAMRYLITYASIYSGLRRRIRSIPPVHLLTSTGGKTFTRALSIAVRAFQGKVSGFPHGHFICHSKSERPYMHEFATVDEFVTYTSGSLELFKRNVAIHPPTRNNPINFISDESPYLLDAWKRFRHMPTPKRIKTVMILELAFHMENSSYHVPSTLVIYHFYYKIIKFLSGHGYKVIFKRRPKSPDWEGLNLFEKIPNVEIAYGTFEDPHVINSADALLLQYGLSSTFMYALCTNKTIIYADAGWELWFDDVYELMAKRCKILHCWHDERNCQCFDGNELLALLEEKPATPNMEFIEKYLFPTK